MISLCIVCDWIHKPRFHLMWLTLEIIFNQIMNAVKWAWAFISNEHHIYWMRLKMYLAWNFHTKKNEINHHNTREIPIFSNWVLAANLSIKNAVPSPVSGPTPSTHPIHKQRTDQGLKAKWSQTFSWMSRKIFEENKNRCEQNHFVMHSVGTKKSWC